MSHMLIVIKIVAALVFGTCVYTGIVWCLFKDIGKIPTKKE